MMKLIFIVTGGALGTLSRYVLAGFAHRIFNTAVFPIGTLVVNLIGSFIIGLLWGAFETITISPNLRSFLFIGILGGFTTFSAYSIETLNLFREGNLRIAILNILLNNVLGILLALGGLTMARLIR